MTLLGGNGTASDNSGLSKEGHGGDVHGEEAEGEEDNGCVG